MHTISAALHSGSQQLTNDDTRLEAEILLAHVLNVSRAYLHTWPEKNLTAEQEKDFFSCISKRAQGEPIAYLIGHREFWSLDLIVTPDVLIPRPETELLVEKILSSGNNQESLTVADLGTGSGAIALAVAKERPNWTVYATDASQATLDVAKWNAKRFNIHNIIFCHGEWCNALPQMHFDIIVSNPPYIAEEDPHLNQGDLRFEPRRALVSPENGLHDITQIILEARSYLKQNGLLLLEHGFEQAKNVSCIFEKAGYTYITTQKDLSQLDRMTFATWVF